MNPLLHAIVQDGGDFEAVKDASGLVLLKPLSDRAGRWIENNVVGRTDRTEGGAIVCERRLFENLADAIVGAGMTFEVGRTYN